MSSDLVSLRVLIVCASGPDGERLRQGATQAMLPVEIDEADTAGKATALLEGGGFDLVLIDPDCPQANRASVVTAARTGKTPALVVLLGVALAATDADAVTAKPGDVRAATSLFDRCVRARLPCRVLVVDDSSTMRTIVRKILSGSRFQLDVSEAGEGASCLSRVRNGSVDVVFLDYNMPGIDGIATLGEIKRTNPNVDVVLMTSTQDDVIAKRAIHAGASAFLKKPFYTADIDALLFARCGLTPCRAA